MSKEMSSKFGQSWRNMSLIHVWESWKEAANKLKRQMSSTFEGYCIVPNMMMYKSESGARTQMISNRLFF